MCRKALYQDAFSKTELVVQHFRTASCRLFRQTVRLHGMTDVLRMLLNPAGFTAQTRGVYIAGGVAKQLTWCTWRRPGSLKKKAEVCQESEKQSATEML